MGSKSAVGATATSNIKTALKGEAKMTETGKRKLKNVKDCPNVYSTDKYKRAALGLCSTL